MEYTQFNLRLSKAPAVALQRLAGATQHPAETSKPPTKACHAKLA